MKKLYEVFGKSPFDPLKDHMQKVRECVDLLPSFMDEYLKGDYNNAKNIFKDICKVEHEADCIKRDLRNHLPKSFLMPVARADLLSYLKQQDNIADAAEDLGAICMLKKLKLPKKLHEPLKDMITKNLEVVYLISDVTEAIQDLSAKGFTGKKAERVLKRIEKVEYEEWQCDKAQMSFSKKLFEFENKMDPTSVMLWFNIVRVISKLSNASESVGTQMRMMLAKR
jgi:predicted phosphate transport protein (TIGR00153 family)